MRRIAVTLLLSLVGLIPTGASNAGARTVAATPPLVGFTFRPHTVEGMGLEPRAALGRLLAEIEPDVVRLPVYWSDAATTVGRLDFSSADALLAVVGTHNARPNAVPARAVLVVGMRNVGFPELFAPPWAVARAGESGDALSRLPEYGQYFDAAIRRYSGSALLRAWQVENEPLDSTRPPGQAGNALPASLVAAEVERVHALDPRHRVMVTSFNSSTVDLDEAETRSAESGMPPPAGPAQPGGHPEESLELGDVLGLDLYVVSWSVDLKSASVKKRIGWKRNTLPYWARRSAHRGAELWIAEMQAAPWRGLPGFNPDDLVDSAALYAGHGARAILLWGVESWLTMPTWMRAGLEAVRVMRRGGA